VAGQALQITNPDAVQEVAVQTGNYDAEYGRSGAAVVNTITKSGTNEFHGTARYLLESTVLDAPTNIQKLSPAVLQRGHPLPGTDQFFSGTVGGPIIKNKTFFFSSYQEERQV
jgi:outer membrane receptor protein involved in Fe transport